MVVPTFWVAVLLVPPAVTIVVMPFFGTIHNDDDDDDDDANIIFGSILNFFFPHATVVFRSIIRRRPCCFCWYRRRRLQIVRPEAYWLNATGSSFCSQRSYNGNQWRRGGIVPAATPDPVRTIHTGYSERKIQRGQNGEQPSCLAAPSFRGIQRIIPSPY